MHMRAGVPCLYFQAWFSYVKSQTIGDFVISRSRHSRLRETSTSSCFHSRECLGWSGNNKIPDGLGLFLTYENQASVCYSLPMGEQYSYRLAQ